MESRKKKKKLLFLFDPLFLNLHFPGKVNTKKRKSDRERDYYVFMQWSLNFPSSHGRRKNGVVWQITD